MNAPESQSSADEALSSLMGAALGTSKSSRPDSISAPAYGSPADVALRIRDYIGRHGRENTATLLLYEAMNALRRPAPAAGDALALPELNADLIDILGRPNFTCIRIAQLLRLSGVEIDKKAEAEQATVIHYLLGFYLKHGSQWAEKAGEDIERLRLAAIATQQGKGEAA
ncbi:MAG: hypothetical protein QHC81_01140 [Achromobacter sp.]|nr:hypothetical protein [Achromobacter sp.]